MSSGFGLKGRIGRCYPYYADFMQCVVSEDWAENGLRWVMTYVVLWIVQTYLALFFCYRSFPQQNVEDESPNVCTPEKMDYFECLHHKKEYARMAIIKKTAAKLEADRISGGVHHWQVALAFNASMEGNQLEGACRPWWIYARGIFGWPRFNSLAI